VPDICVNTDQVAACGGRVQGLAGRSAELNGMAAAASVPELSWGALGHLTTLYSQYDELLRDLQSHFDAMSEGFDKIGGKLRDTAQSYRDADDLSAEHLASFLKEPHPPRLPAAPRHRTGERRRTSTRSGRATPTSGRPAARAGTCCPGRRAPSRS